MLYNLEQIKESFENHQRVEYLFFWGHHEQGSVSKACFSQWYPCVFEVEGATYYTTEQFMMAQKALLFQDHEIYNQIQLATNPKEFKSLGRKICGFQEAVWDAHKYEIVLKGNKAKFSQNQALADFLVETNSKVLVEASPYDTIWGIGLSQDDKNIENPHCWNGQNLLGFALMEVRDSLRTEMDVSATM